MKPNSVYLQITRNAPSLRANSHTATLMLSLEAHTTKNKELHRKFTNFLRKQNSTGRIILDSINSGLNRRSYIIDFKNAEDIKLLLTEFFVGYDISWSTLPDQDESQITSNDVYERATEALS